MNESDPRVAELLELAASEGLRLPMPAETIVHFERQGHIVDLLSGEVYTVITSTPTPSGKAVSHLLADVKGEVAL